MSDEEKTYRVGWMCATLVILGFFVFLFKIDACKDGCETAASCHDEFYQVDDAHKEVTCTSGAKAEFVSSPPAPKAGVLCHCVTKSEKAAVHQ